MTTSRIWPRDESNGHVEAAILNSVLSNPNGVDTGKQIASNNF